MSTCISREGEYSEHLPSEHDPLTCARCYEFDEVAARVALAKAKVEIIRLYAPTPPADMVPAAALREVIEAWSKPADIPTPDTAFRLGVKDGIDTGVDEVLADLRALLPTTAHTAPTEGDAR